MGYHKLKRPLDARLPGSQTAGASATVPSVRAGLVQASYGALPVVGAATSAGASIGPRGTYVLGADTSAGGAAPKVVYLANPISSGDVCTVMAFWAGGSSNGIAMRTLTSGAGGVSLGGTTANDQLLFMSPGYSATLIAMSTLQWAVAGVTTAGPSTIWPGGVLGVSTS